MSMANKAQKSTYSDPKTLDICLYFDLLAFNDTVIMEKSKFSLTVKRLRESQ